MVNQFREKIALAVFFGLVILGFCSLIGYLMLGYSWNVAATNIDDATGSLDDYTVIIFDGVAVPTSKSDPSIEKDYEENSSDLLDEQQSDVDNKQAPSTSDSANSNILYDEAISSLNAPNIDVDDVMESYHEKSSAVVVLDIADFNTYSDGLILKKGNHRFGVFSVDNTTSKVQIRQTVNYLKSHDVDFILAITNDRALVEKASSIDIVISTNPKDAISSGETLNNAFYVSAPAEGSVGVIFISPSNVVSAKVLNEV